MFRSGLGKVFWIDRNCYKLAQLKQLEIGEKLLVSHYTLGSSSLDPSLNAVSCFFNGEITQEPAAIHSASRLERGGELLNFMLFAPNIHSILRIKGL
jgi:hypothetical protein